MQSAEHIVEIDSLIKHYPVGGGLRAKQVLRAVDGVSLSIRKGETLGLVGESGCGKSTTGQLAAQLIPLTGGEIKFKGKNITQLRGRKSKAVRREIQYVFQDPYTSLNPRHTLGTLLEEPLIIHGIGDRRERKYKVHDMLERVGLNSAYSAHYAHELSGGQRQRVGIARALMLEPEFLILDEPVSALDVSVQSQILNLLQDLQSQFDLTYLFISHDLNVVHYMSDRVAVMYLGKVVELTDVEALYAAPLHPYTQALISAIPAGAGEIKRERIILQGELPNPLEIQGGCSFRSRCPYAYERCGIEVPALTPAGEGHLVRCHLHA
ncbi:Oligopeptide transport ATP-binding protein OppF [compost metagenome]